MFMIIPAVFLALFIPFLIKAIRNSDYGNVKWFGLSLTFGILLTIALIVCPISYYTGRGNAWRAEQYYEHIIQPNVVEETENYVVVSNIEAGIWQAGDTNVFDYNSYLVTIRHWQDVPVVGWIIYPVPEQLKYVRIEQ